MYTKGPAAPAQFKANIDQRILEGYASIFGNVDLVGDVVVAGAFKRTLAARLPQGMLKSCYNHGPLIGSLRDGTTEDSTGLFTVAKISQSGLGTAVLQDVVDGHLTHQSFAYDVTRKDYLQPEDPSKSPVRRLLEVKLYEAGPVDFPANELAAIVGAKQVSEAIEEAMGAVPELTRLWEKKGFFKDSELDLHRHLMGVVATAISSALKALSETPPEPAASADAEAVTTALGDPPPTAATPDPEEGMYAFAIASELSSLKTALHSPFRAASLLAGR